MIILPTRQNLEHRRANLYQHLYDILPHASIRQVEAVMRQIHQINMRIIIYFKREIHEQK